MDAFVPLILPKPHSSISGLSVLFLKIITRLLKLGASSCSPPESDTINLHFGRIIPYADLEKADSLIEITKLIRQKTYSLDPNPVNN